MLQVDKKIYCKDARDSTWSIPKTLDVVFSFTIFINFVKLEKYVVNFDRLIHSSKLQLCTVWFLLRSRSLRQPLGRATCCPEKLEKQHLRLAEKLQLRKREISRNLTLASRKSCKKSWVNRTFKGVT